jgi:O-antigen ligase
MCPSSYKAKSENSFALKMLFLLWIIKLFYPEVLVAYYVPALGFVRKFPTLMIIMLFVSSLLSNQKKKEGYWWLAFFLFSLLMSSIGSENTGRARLALRLVLEYYLLARLTFFYCVESHHKKLLFRIYIYSFLYIGTWGIIFFLLKGRALILWDYILNEEDAFGPLMCIGFAVSSSMLLSGKIWQNRKKLLILTVLIGAVGVILSFARGAFLVFLAVVLFNLKKSENFLKGLLVFVLLLVVIITASSVFFKDDVFWKEMSTVSEGTKSGTGRDRRVLWSIALEEFKANPFLGVGPFNFGVVAGDYLHLVPDKRDYRTETIWGRALHNGFFQILCEGGIIGSFAFLMLLVDYCKRTRGQSYLGAEKNGYEVKILVENVHYLQAIHIGVIAFLLNAFFYDIIYYSWFYQLLILSRFFSVTDQETIE